MGGSPPYGLTALIFREANAMRTYLFCFSTLVVAVLSAPVTAWGQGPQAYSLTLKLPGGMTIELARDGSKESVEQIIAPSKNGPGMHIRSIYDFAAHKVWTLNLDGGPCSVVAYTSPAAPSMFDPIAGAEEMRAGLAQFKPAVLRTETVNGIATNVHEMPFPEVEGKMRMFLDQKQGFAVKMVLIAGDGKEQTQMEITRLSFAKPAAGQFVPPKDCQVQAGETNATGGHIETAISEQAQGEVKLGEAQPVVPDVVIRRAVANPLHYTGPAPAAFTFSFSIEASGPIEADWVLVLGEIAMESGKLVFGAAGSKQLNVPAKIGTSNGAHWDGAVHLEVVVGEKRFSSATLQIAADCKAK
jgi:hypothetical protein